MIMPRENAEVTPDETDVDDEDERTLFCANLDERVTEDILYEVFLQAGPVESARIPKDHSGRQRTFGFITYVHKSTASYALQLYQGMSLYRKTLTIKYKGSAPPSPMGSYISPGCSNKSFNYNNSSLRGSNYSSYKDSTPHNPFKNGSTPDFSINSDMHSNISKYASAQRRQHKNISPYQRNTDFSENRNRDTDRERDHNRRRQYNNGSNRHSDQRFGGKNRR